MSKKVFIISGFIIATLFFSIAAVSLPVNAQSPDFIPGETRVVVAFGKIPGQDLYAHVWVVIPPNSDKNQIVNESLRHQGLKPFSHTEFSETGLRHDQFFDESYNPVLVQYYNPANDPTGNGYFALLNTQITWTNPAFGNFAFEDGFTTDRCPSLVKECQGRQVTDGNNDVAWMPIKNKNTLGVTWYSISADEADMALNTNFSWSTDGTDGTFDVETVYLHENGHVLGLGHSDVDGSIMEAVYEGERRYLHQDDICGIQTIYGTPDPVLCAPAESPVDPTPGKAVAADISYSAKKGKGGNLFIYVTLTDVTANGVSDTTVKIQLFLDGNSVGIGTGTTNGDGKTSFRLSGASTGTYTTTVLEVAGITWTGTTNDPGFEK